MGYQAVAGVLQQVNRPNGLRLRAGERHEQGNGDRAAQEMFAEAYRMSKHAGPL
jgi:hypothetical protein